MNFEYLDPILTFLNVAKAKITEFNLHYMQFNSLYNSFLTIEGGDDLFTQAFVFYLHIVLGNKPRDEIYTYSIEELGIQRPRSRLGKICRRFVFLVNVLLFFRSQKFNEPFYTLATLLNYRGLSKTGFHLLNELGLSRTPNIVMKKIKLINDTHYTTAPEDRVVVYWADNLRRKQFGIRLPAGDLEDSFTTFGMNIIYDLPTINWIEDYPAIDNSMFNDDCVMELYNCISLSQGLNVWECDPINRLDKFKNPLRSENSRHYKFYPIEIMDVRSGTVSGTMSIIKNHMKTAHPNGNDDEDTHYSVLVVDYDIYWRINRFIWSRSIQGSLPSFKKYVCLILGPWHIYKTMADNVWGTFAPLLFGKQWGLNNRFGCNSNAAIHQQLPYFISIFANRQEFSDALNAVAVNVEPMITYKKLLLIAINTLIPLVLQLGQSIQENDADSFFSILPFATTQFFALGCPNYTNACELFWLQWNYYTRYDQPHPCVNLLRNHFSACSEEKGESSIHVLMIHVKDFNYTGPNLHTHYVQTNSFMTLMRKFKVRLSHKTNDGKWDDLNLNNAFRQSLLDHFLELTEQLNRNEFVPFAPASNYQRNSPLARNVLMWQEVLNNFETAHHQTGNHCVKLKQKMEKDLSAPAMATLGVGEMMEILLQ